MKQLSKNTPATRNRLRGCSRQKNSARELTGHIQAVHIQLEHPLYPSCHRTQCPRLHRSESPPCPRYFQNHLPGELELAHTKFVCRVNHGQEQQENTNIVIHSTVSTWHTKCLCAELITARSNRKTQISSHRTVSTFLEQSHYVVVFLFWFFTDWNNCC